MGLAIIASLIAYSVRDKALDVLPLNHNKAVNAR